MDVEWVILADFAEIVGTKLYLMGGGWDVLRHQGDFPLRRPVGVAVSFRVPWDNTNQKQAFNLEILTEDGESLGTAIQGQVEAGRPAGIPPGTSQRVQLALNMELQLEKPGGYVVHVNVADDIKGKAPFFVVKI